MAFLSISARRLRWSAPVLMVLCLTSPTSLHAAKDNIYVIVGAKLVTVSGGTIESGTLVLRDGVIEALGNAVNIPPDARVIDGKGLTLTPGLIDGFGGIGLPGTRPSSGGPPSDLPTSSSTPAAPSSALTPQALALEKVRPTEVTRSRDSGITTALVIPREGVLPGQSVLLNLAGNKAEAMAIKQPAALHVHMTTTSPRYPASLMGTMAYLRQALHDTRRYREEWTAYEKSPLGKKRPQYDAALAAWQDVLERRQLLVVTASPRERYPSGASLGGRVPVKTSAGRRSPGLSGNRPRSWAKRPASRQRELRSAKAHRSLGAETIRRRDERFKTQKRIPVYCIEQASGLHWSPATHQIFWLGCRRPSKKGCQGKRPCALLLWDLPKSSVWLIAQGVSKLGRWPTLWLGRANHFRRKER